MNNDRIIKLIREMMSIGGTASAPGFSGKADPRGPVSGFDPALDLRKKYGRKLNMFYRKRLQSQRKKKKKNG
tara:strand:- start:1155 stop:1370 length:216 start_codon:yes stop_codon:yes gene_type:complete